MKKILLILGAVVGLAFTGTPARAQSYSVNTLTITGTVAASGSMTVSSTVGIISAERWQTIAIQPSFALGAAGTANVVFNFAKSADKGATWETVPSLSGTIAGIGTGTAVGVITLNTGGASTIKLVSIVNSNTSTIVNPILTIGRKPGF